ARSVESASLATSLEEGERSATSAALAAWWELIRASPFSCDLDPGGAGEARRTTASRAAIVGPRTTEGAGRPRRARRRVLRRRGRGGGPRRGARRPSSLRSAR